MLPRLRRPCGPASDARVLNWAAPAARALRSGRAPGRQWGVPSLSAGTRRGTDLPGCTGLALRIG